MNEHTRSVQRDQLGIWGLGKDLCETILSDCSYNVLSLFSIWGGVHQCHKNLKVATDSQNVRRHLVRTGCECGLKGWRSYLCLGPRALPSYLASLPPLALTFCLSLTLPLPPSQLPGDSHLVPSSNLFLLLKYSPLFPHQPTPMVFLDPSGCLPQVCPKHPCFSPMPASQIRTVYPTCGPKIGPCPLVGCKKDSHGNCQ